MLLLPTSMGPCAFQWEMSWIRLHNTPPAWWTLTSLHTSTWFNSPCVLRIKEAEYLAVYFGYSVASPLLTISMWRNFIRKCQLNHNLLEELSLNREVHFSFRLFKSWGHMCWNVKLIFFCNICYGVILTFIDIYWVVALHPGLILHFSSNMLFATEPVMASIAINVFINSIARLAKRRRNSGATINFNDYEIALKKINIHHLTGACKWYIIWTMISK